MIPTCKCSFSSFRVVIAGSFHVGNFTTLLHTTRPFILADCITWGHQGVRGRASDTSTHRCPLAWLICSRKFPEGSRGPKNRFFRAHANLSSCSPSISCCVCTVMLWPSRAAIPALRIAHRSRIGSSAFVRMYAQMHRDPDTETGLYYHPLSESKWALSLLERTPSSESSPEVIGILSEATENPSQFLRDNPDASRMNAAFWNALHDVLQEAIADDEQLRTEAYLRGDGWAHLGDLRSEVMPGRTTPTEDILGSVAFTDARLIPTSYERNDMYRFCVAGQGPMKLKDTWLSKLRAHLKQHS